MRIVLSQISSIAFVHRTDGYEQRLEDGSESERVILLQNELSVSPLAAVTELSRFILSLSHSES